MQKDGDAINSSAKDRQWILSSPGTRTQHFSDDAQIISIHMMLSNPGNGAEWTGPATLQVTPDEKAEQALNRLLQCPSIQNLNSEQRLDLRSLKLPLLEYLELQSYGSQLFYQALRIAANKGMRYEVPNIQDPRVQASHRTLAGLDVRQRFSRQELAAKEGLTAGQLDRLWRAELGMTTNQYRDTQRLTYACQKLRQHDIPIKVIAAELGFRHLSQFSNWFTSRHKESPRSFRKRPGTS
jgi:AraC-like DNA-binding protein